MSARPRLAGTVGLAMYSFEELRPAWQRLWSRVVRDLPWLPAELTWHTDLHAAWRSPDLVVDQTCGWPLVTELAGTVRVVGAFAYDVPFADGHTYRSVLVARLGGEPSHLAGSRAAVNGRDSLSGWVSLVDAVHGPGATWAGPVVWTGAHVESVRAVAEGRADLASIDAVTWRHVQRLHPELVGGLVEVGHGPRVPSLPVIAALKMSDDDIAHLRRALAGALADPDLADDRHTLLLDGFVPLELEDYLALRELTPAD